MTAAAPPFSLHYQRSSNDRLGLTLFVALAIHAVVVLAVGFHWEPHPHVSRSNLEVILVQRRETAAPDQAEYLAQASQDGGGDRRERVRPGSPAPVPAATRRATVPAVAPASREAVPPAPSLAPRKTVLATRKAPTRVANEPAQRAPPRPVRKSRPRPEVVRRERISAAALASRSLEMASLDVELAESLRAYAQRPRQKFINARTREYKYAAYMEAWRSKVERIGNLNYPDAARRRHLSGSLLLDVALKPNGRIHRITLRRSSGFKPLDDAAIRIVRLAAPYAPFPPGIKRETDILHIERTWQFLASNRLFAR